MLEPRPYAVAPTERKAATTGQELGPKPWLSACQGQLISRPRGPEVLTWGIRPILCRRPHLPVVIAVLRIHESPYNVIWARPFWRSPSVCADELLIVASFRQLDAAHCPLSACCSNVPRAQFSFNPIGGTAPSHVKGPKTGLKGLCQLAASSPLLRLALVFVAGRKANRG